MVRFTSRIRVKDLPASRSNSSGWRRRARSSGRPGWGGRRKSAGDDKAGGDRALLHQSHESAASPAVDPTALDYSRSFGGRAGDVPTLVGQDGRGLAPILVPVAGGLQIWQHHETAFPGALCERRRRVAPVQFIPQAVDTRVLPTADNDGYTRSFGLSLCLEDVNRDGRDDLMIQREMGGGMQVFSLYWQNTNGQFDVEPAFSYTNHGRLAHQPSLDGYPPGRPADLIKSTYPTSWSCRGCRRARCWWRLIWPMTTAGCPPNRSRCSASIIIRLFPHGGCGWRRLRRPGAGLRSH